MRSSSLLPIALLLVATPVSAGLPEIEPNDACHEAMRVEIGRTVSASINAPGDRDHFLVDPDQDGGLKITVDTGHPPDAGPRLVRLRLHAVDCTHELAYSDDYIAPRAVIIHRVVRGRTYKIRVEGYDPDDVLDYTLTLEPVPFEPAGDTCDDPRALPHGEFRVVSTTTGLSDDYLSWSHGGGAPDAVFGVTLGPGDWFRCVFEETSTWLVRMLIDDCGAAVLDPFFEHVDWHMELRYRNPDVVPRRYYLIVDGFHQGVEGGFILTGVNEGSGLVADEAWDWGRVKALYR